MRQIRFDPGAAHELSEALDWYAERGAGLPFRLIEGLRVIALAHASRRPLYWTDRLDE